MEEQKMKRIDARLVWRCLAVTIFLVLFASSVRQAQAGNAKEVGRDDRFIAYSDETVLDTRTNLMWTAKDNGSNISWGNAKRYCKNYRGGGYSGWRMPTQDELEGLYDKSKSRPMRCYTAWNVHLTHLIDLSCAWAWASETRDSNAALFHFGNGLRYWVRKSTKVNGRVLAVRVGK
jgi:hypothetical protein